MSLLVKGTIMKSGVTHSLQQVDNLNQALDALLFLANDLGDTICALWRNVGENLQTTSNFLQDIRKKKTLKNHENLDKSKKHSPQKQQKRRTLRTKLNLFLIQS